MTAVLCSQAGTLTWDVVDNGLPIEEGPGTWTAVDTTWNNGSASTSYSSGSDVVFGGGGITPGAPTTTVITIGAGFNPNASSITFNSGALYKITDPSGNRTINLSSGVITANADGIIEVGITAASGITKLGSGTLQLIDNGLVIANGMTTVSSGTLVLSKSGVNAVSALGLTINAPSAKVQLQQNDQISNDATVKLLDGTLDLTTRNDQIDTLNLTQGSVTGSGTLTASGAFNVQSGSIDANLKGAALNKSTAGTVVLGGNNSAYVGAVNISGGTLQVGSGGSSGALGSGTVTVGNGAKISFNRGDSNLNIPNRVTGGGRLEVSGSGTVTVSGSNNDYTGGTILSAGTLKLGNAGALPAGGEVRFSGGALSLNNIDVTSSRMLGALTLTANSWLLLDPNNSTHGSITFNGATGIGGQFSILGWSGTVGGHGSDDRIFINGAVDPGFLSHVQFYLPDNVTPNGSGAQILPDGELVPAVPEPTNIALAIFGAVFVTTRVVRRSRRSKCHRV